MPRSPDLAEAGAPANRTPSDAGANRASTGSGPPFGIALVGLVALLGIAVAAALMRSGRRAGRSTGR